MHYHYQEEDSDMPFYDDEDTGGGYRQDSYQGGGYRGAGAGGGGGGGFRGGGGGGFRRDHQPPLHTEKLATDRKIFFLDLKENERGRVIKITEDVRGRRDTIMVPVEMLSDFIDALHRIEEADAASGAPRGQEGPIDDGYEDDGSPPAPQPDAAGPGEEPLPVRQD